MVQEMIPVVKNMEVELLIENLGHEGEGVGRYQGFTLFVPGALAGERIRAKVVKVKKNYGYAKLLELLPPAATASLPHVPSISDVAAARSSISPMRGSFASSNNW